MKHARHALPEWAAQKSRSEIENAIKAANLGRENAKIARLRYLEQLPLADIAACVYLDRTTVGARLHGVIDEKLKKVI